MLQVTATPFPAGSSCTATCGAGIVNAAAAVAQANGGGGPTPPGAFGKTAPANLASVAGTSTTLQWGSSPSAASFAYCVDTTADSSCSTAWVNTGAATSAILSNLSSGTTYYWQVRATNAAGDTVADGGAWWTFSTQVSQTLPGAFSKLSPSSGQKNRSRPVALTWGASTGATSYEWCVSTTSGSCTSWTSTSGTSVSVGGLAPRTQYYWQVRARNGSGTTDANGGSWWGFRTR